MNATVNSLKKSSEVIYFGKTKDQIRGEDAYE